jgi:hypothetical protein
MDRSYALDRVEHGGCRNLAPELQASRSQATGRIIGLFKSSNRVVQVRGRQRLQRVHGNPLPFVETQHNFLVQAQLLSKLFCDLLGTVLRGDLGLRRPTGLRLAGNCRGGLNRQGDSDCNNRNSAAQPS